MKKFNKEKNYSYPLEEFAAKISFFSIFFGNCQLSTLNSQLKNADRRKNVSMRPSMFVSLNNKTAEPLRPSGFSHFSVRTDY